MRRPTCFLAAATTQPAQLYAAGKLLKPVNFTRNKLVIVVPKNNPAGINDIYDLTKPGIKIVVANSTVPVGSYTLQILKNMNLTATVTPNFVSQETDVRAVLTKIATGQGDAGFVYSTDAQTVPNDVNVIKVPAWAQPKVVYAMGVVASSPNQAKAKAYMAEIMSKKGQATLKKYGFLPADLVQRRQLLGRAGSARRPQRGSTTRGRAGEEDTARPPQLRGDRDRDGVLRPSDHRDLHAHRHRER